MPQPPSLNRDCRCVLRDFWSLPQCELTPTLLPSLTFTRIHSSSLLTACCSDNLKGSESPSLQALWWTSQSKRGEKDWCKILPCDKPRRFRCWRRTLTRRSNWGYHSWAKVQLREELTCDTNTMNTIYFSSPDQSKLSRQLLWLLCNFCHSV